VGYEDFDRNGCIGYVLHFHLIPLTAIPRVLIVFPALCINFLIFVDVLSDGFCSGGFFYFTIDEILLTISSIAFISLLPSRITTENKNIIKFLEIQSLGNSGTRF
jgi:hypothetical protein